MIFIRGRHFQFLISSPSPGFLFLPLAYGAPGPKSSSHRARSEGIFQSPMSPRSSHPPLPSWTSKGLRCLATSQARKKGQQARKNFGDGCFFLKNPPAPRLKLLVAFSLYQSLPALHPLNSGSILTNPKTVLFAFASGVFSWVGLGASRGH